MQKNKFLNSSFSKNKLSRHTKPDKSNFEIFKDILLYGFPSFIFFIAAAFTILDYYTLVDIFNFNSAMALEVYFNTFDTTTQIFIAIAIAVFPFIIIFIFLTIPYLNSLVLEKYHSNVKKSTKTLIEIVISSFLALVLLILSTLSYCIFLKIEGYGFIVIILSLLLPLLLTSFIASAILNKLNIDIKVIIKDSPILFGSSFSISYIILIFIFYNTLLDIFKSEFIITFLMVIFIYQLTTTIIISNRDYSSTLKTNSKNKFFTSPIIYLALLLVIFFINIFDKENKDLWDDAKEEKTNFSFNLFLNKFFLSDNHTIIDINATYYENNNSEIKQCWNNKIKNIHLDSNQTTYLPISNEMKLYFKKEDKNITCVYAISKNQYNYRLQDIGYIDTQRRSDFEKAITKDKK